MKTNDLWYFLDELLKGNKLAMIFRRGTRVANDKKNPMSISRTEMLPRDNL